MDRILISTDIDSAQLRNAVIASDCRPTGEVDGEVVAALVSDPAQAPPSAHSAWLRDDFDKVADPVATAVDAGVDLVVPSELGGDLARRVIATLLAKGGSVPVERYVAEMRDRLLAASGRKLNRLGYLAHRARNDDAKRERLREELRHLTRTAEALAMEALAEACRRGIDASRLDPEPFLRDLKLAVQGVAPGEDRSLSKAFESGPTQNFNVDSASGLAERRAIVKHLRCVLAEDRRCGLCLVRIDGLAAYNRNHGESAGNRILRGVGTILQSQPAALRARWSGPTLAVVVPDLTTAEARQHSEKILEAVRMVLCDDQDLRVSAGIACAPEHGTTVEALVEAAEAALGRSRGGDGRVASGIVGDQYLVAVTCDDDTLAGLLRHALRNRQLGCLVLESAADLRARLDDEERRTPDLLVIDRALGDGDGLHLLREIQGREEADVPVILIADRGGDDEVVEGIEAGAADYLVKPVSLPVLMAKVVQALGARRGRT